MNKAKYMLKQLFPMMYWCKYKDATGNKDVAIWRQWFGKVLWCKHFQNN